MIFICDESGNSGSNFNDINQPFFVLGGFLLEEKNIDVMKRNINNATKSDEVHAKKLLRNSYGRKKTKKIIEDLFKVATPIMVICEKRYAIAAKINETLLDSAYNDKAPSLKVSLQLSKIQRQFAEDFYELSSSLLFDFYESYKQYNADSMKGIIKRIIQELSNKNNNELASILEGALDKIDKNLLHEKNAKGEKYLESLNLPMFVVLISMLKDLANDLQTELEVIHDNIPEFSKGFKSYIDLDNSVNKVTMLNYGNGNKFIVGNNNIKKIEFRDSKEFELIQCADILVSTMNKILTMSNNNEKILNDSTYTDLFKLLIPYVYFFENPKFTHYMVSDTFHKNMIEPLIQKLGLTKLINQIIDR